MKVFGLVFLFIIQLHFLRSQSIAVIRKRYGDKALKNVRMFERLDYQVRKCQLDIEFLNVINTMSFQTFYDSMSQIKH